MITTLIARVTAHPLLRLTRCDIRAPRPAAELARLETRAGRKLPAAYRDLYAEMDGCHIEWTLAPEAHDLRAQLEACGLAFEGQAEPLGRIAIVPVEDLLLGNAYLDFDPTLDDPIDFAGRPYREGEFLQTLRPFDVIDDATLAVALTDDPEWKLLLLTGNWSDFDASKRIRLEDYLHLTTTLWALRAARSLVLGKYRGDRDPPVTAADIEAIQLPASLTAA